MRKSRSFWSAAAVVTGVAIALPLVPARAQSRRVVPERTLLGVSLGRPAMEVLRRYGTPNEIQTVALTPGGTQLPGLGGVTEGGAMGGATGGYPGGAMGGYPGGAMGGYPGGAMGGYPGGAMGGYPGGAMGGYPGGAMGGAFGGGSPFGGPPALPPAGGEFDAAAGYPGGAMGGYPGGAMGGYPGGAMGALPGGGAQMPEYSTAALWIYKRPKGVRYEFLINEDGRVAQISVAAPAGVPVPGARTRRGIGLGSTFAQVMQAYGTPERYRAVPGLRFYETYYTKSYRAAFTFDTQKGMKVVRITIALAD